MSASLPPLFFGRLLSPSAWVAKVGGYVVLESQRIAMDKRKELETLSWALQQVVYGVSMLLEESQNHSINPPLTGDDITLQKVSISY